MSATEEEEDNDDSHVCLKCKASFGDLDSYVAHRRDTQCRAKDKNGRQDRTRLGSRQQQQVQHLPEVADAAPALPAAVVAPSPHLPDPVATSSPSSSWPKEGPLDFFHSLHLQQVSRTAAAEHPTCASAPPALPSPPPPVTPPSSSSSATPSLAVPGVGSVQTSSERLRRPSADQAAAFMETLGLHLSTKAPPQQPSQHPLQSPSSKRDSSATPRPMASPARAGRESECWDENLLLWPIEQMDFGAGSGGGESHPARPSKHSLISYKHPCQHTGRGGGLLDFASFSSFAMSPSQNDFMRHFELMNVSSLGVVDIGGTGTPALQQQQQQQEQQQDASADAESSSISKIPEIGEISIQVEDRSEAGSESDNQATQPGTVARWRLWTPSQQDEDRRDEEADHNHHHDVDFLQHVFTQQDEAANLNYEDVSSGGTQEDSVQATEAPSALKAMPAEPPDVSAAEDDAEERGRGKRQRLGNKRYVSEAAEEDCTRSPEKPKKIASPTESSSSSSSPVVCPTCRSRIFPSSQFGKHLISHYHLHHSHVSTRHPTFRQLVFDHLDEIVRLSPFRCEPCGFFCNWDHEFLDHWRREHRDEEEGDEALVYWCSFCSFSCSSASEMAAHLGGEKHGDIVAAISRVVPIVIRRARLEACLECGKAFRLRFSLRRHLRQRHGRGPDFQLADHRHFACEHCPYSTFSGRAFTSHTFLAHPERRSRYNCFVCRVQFRTKKACEAHRRTAAHRASVKDSKDPAAAEGVSCPFCGESFGTSSDLRQHLSAAHPTDLSQCGACGDRFVSPQELGAHVRGGCRPAGLAHAGGLKCQQDGACKFTCDSLNMLLYHKALRHGPKTSDGTFSCNLCGLAAPTRSKLWEHVRIHGDAHRCEQCYRIFPSSTKLSEHLATSHGLDGNGDPQTGLSCPHCEYTCGKKRLLALHLKRTHFRATRCQECGETLKSFKKAKEHAKLHLLPHPGMIRKHRCTHRDCDYAAKTAWDLKSHLLVHQGKRTLLSCRDCDFRCGRTSELNRHRRSKHQQQPSAKSESNGLRCWHCGHLSSSSQHLRRHLATHDEKSNREAYYCRLCSYSSPSLEGIRKHVLKTSKHAGESVYRCDHCGAETNSLSWFRSHAAAAHSDVFKSSYEAEKYVEDYFKKGKAVG